MFCNNCGARNPDGVRFCTECGAQMPAASNATPAAPAEPVRPAAAPSAYGTAWNPTPAPMPGAPREKKKKSKLGLILGIIAAVVVAAAVLVILNFDAVANFALRTVGSPKSYYAFVEYRGIEALKKETGSAYENVLQRSLQQVDKGSSASLTLELGSSAASMLESYTGEDLSWLQSVGLQMETTRDGDRGGAQLGLSLNGKKLLDADVVMDLGENELQFRVPVLSEAWASQELETGGYGSGTDAAKSFLDSLDGLKEALPDRAKVETLLVRYLKLAAEQVNRVEKDRGTLSADGISEDCWILRVTVTEDDLQRIVETLTKALVKDEDVRGILEDLERGLDRDDLVDRFLDAMEEAGDNADKIRLDDDLIMTVWVDGKGAIRGREITVGDRELRWASPEEKNVRGLVLSLIDDSGERFSLVGSGSLDGELFSGTYTLSVDEKDYLDLDVSGLNRKEMLEGRTGGTFELIPSRALIDELRLDGSIGAVVQNLRLRFTSDLDSAAGGQVSVDLRTGSESLLRITVDSAPGSDYDVPTVRDALPTEDWSTDMMQNGGAQKLIAVLMDSDVPLSLLMEMFG